MRIIALAAPIAPDVSGYTGFPPSDIGPGHPDMARKGNGPVGSSMIE